MAVSELSERTQIPQPFLEQVLLRLKRAGLTTSRRGPEGGYTLARSAERIRLSDIYVAVEGPLNLSASKEHPCETLWNELENTILDFLNNRTLEDVKKSVEKPQTPSVVTHPYTFSI